MRIITNGNEIVQYINVAKYDGVELEIRTVVIPDECKLMYEIVGTKELIGYDLEINLSLDKGEVLRLLPEIIHMCQSKNIELKHNMVTSELTGAPIQILIGKPIVPIDDVDEVARIVFSDPNLLLPQDENCEELYKNQI